MMVFKPEDDINLSKGHTIKIPIIIMMADIRYLKIKSQSHLLDLSMIDLSTQILRYMYRSFRAQITSRPCAAEMVKQV